MGGSLGLALSRSKSKWHVVGVGRRLSRLRLAKARGSVQEYTDDFTAGVRESDIVVLSVPVGDIVPLARKIRPSLKPGSLLMDVGSVKGPVVRALQPIFRNPTGPWFVGTHPMTGSEKTGVEYARADLYEKATCVVTPDPRTSRAAVIRAETFWRGVGARVLRMTPEEHDRWTALTSHLPHLLADALVLSAAKRDGSLRFVKHLSAGSFRDMTRVAGADPRQWASIFQLNAGHLGPAVRLFQKTLKELANRGCSSADLRRANRLYAKFSQSK